MQQPCMKADGFFFGGGGGGITNVTPAARKLGIHPSRTPPAFNLSLPHGLLHYRIYDGPTSRSRFSNKRSPGNI